MARRSKNHLYFFALGVGVGLFSIAISIMLREFSVGLFLPEIGSELLFSLTPGEFESQAIETLGPAAKYSAFAGSIIVTIIVFGLFGILLGNLFAKLKLQKYIIKFLTSFSITFAFFIILTLIIELIIQSRSGVEATSIQVIVLSFLPTQIAFGLIFSLFFKQENETKDKKESIQKKAVDSVNSQVNYDRKEFLRLLFVSTISIPIILFGLTRLFSTNDVPTTQSDAIDLLPKSSSIPPEFQDPYLEQLIGSEVTPTYLFYKIDISPITPEIDVNSWSLKIKGNVGNPLELRYDDIKSMPVVEEYATLACISNKIGGDLIGTALWKGVRLKDILEKAQVGQNAVYIVFRCSDGYDVGIPLNKGLMDGTILAYEMNKETLTNKHGFPVRAIVPGLYGMMNPKWITEIELVNDVYQGYWQRNGWDNVAEYNTSSSIVIPGKAQIRNRFRGLDEMSLTAAKSEDEKVPIAGIAFGGDRGISKIEVSVDGGETWKTAQIKEPLSKYTWVLWTSGFTPPGVKNYKIVVRATDKTGKTQTSEINKPFPNGSTGYHTISV
ncbi:MAG: molybdopterin-dependent oxidoreductase [Nitrososphaeraceae archaeon]